MQIGFEGKASVDEHFEEADNTAIGYIFEFI